MTADELTQLHFWAMAHLDFDSDDVDEALRRAGLDPDDPSGYTREAALQAVRTWYAETHVPPFPPGV